MRTLTRSGLAAVACSALAGTAMATGGVTRFGDWTNTGSNPESAAAHAWVYEMVDAPGDRGLSAAPQDRWYAAARTTLQWDPLWMATGVGAYSPGDDLSPPITRTKLVHHMASHALVPAVRWVNLGGTGELAVRGDVVLRWAGVPPVGNAVDVALVRVDAMGQVGDLLWSIGGAHLSEENNLALPVDVTTPLGPGESVMLSFRGQTDSGFWLSAFDQLNYTFTTVPAPGSAALLLAAGLAAGRRRR